MAGASDKARYYLEQSVPELHDLLRRKLFTKKEITAIAKTRSDFEHKLNARGSRPGDYARYAGYEMNLESLRRKRYERKGLKGSGHTGPRRIFFVLDRATKKFSGDVALWMQYVEFARKQKANKKLSQILTTVLRLHPTNPELWIYAANYALEENSDVTKARSCMQRGLRFCKQSKRLWSEYTKLEMMYMSRIHARGRLLGLRAPNDDRAENDNDFLTIPTTIANQTGPDEFEYIDREVLEKLLEKLQETPALSGAIPIAIFDAAMKQFAWDSDLGKELFDIAASFQGVPSVAIILRHIVQSLQDMTPSSPATMSCFFREPSLSVETTSAGYPTALRESLNRLKVCVQTLSAPLRPDDTARSHAVLAREAVDWTMLLLSVEDLDEDIAKVLLATLKKTWNQLLIDLEVNPIIGGNEFAGLLEALQKKGFKSLGAQGVTVGLHLWPDNPRIAALERSVSAIGEVPQ